eukprot:gnl/MRDRNA2_/MRDRNA2_111175_c0_seq1.p1 gnl/MRDRNA2_/MRDRNA2_111175_c0~~gnl/MRDRNA2_/MRDRNA2_111175_c0_seq1.p1  ORF type:complete len:315 (-),score=64.99 gnl/MRDRNA2_/MRDRNA2_111175_c0_seq1:229-1173(-)
MQAFCRPTISCRNHTLPCHQTERAESEADTCQDWTDKAASIKVDSKACRTWSDLGFKVEATSKAKQHKDSGYCTRETCRIPFLEDTCIDNVIISHDPPARTEQGCQTQLMHHKRVKDAVPELGPHDPQAGQEDLRHFKNRSVPPLDLSRISQDPHISVGTNVPMVKLQSQKANDIDSEEKRYLEEADRAATKIQSQFRRRQAMGVTAMVRERQWFEVVADASKKVGLVNAATRQTTHDTSEVHALGLHDVNNENISDTGGGALTFDERLDLIPKRVKEETAKRASKEDGRLEDTQPKGPKMLKSLKTRFSISKA